MRLFAAFILAVIIPVAGFSEFSLWNTKNPNSNPILDRSLVPDYSFYAGFIPDSKVEGFEETSLIEVGGYWDIDSYEEAAFNGDVDIQVYFDITSFLDDARLDLPNQVTDLYVDLGWTYRLNNTASFQGRVMPGIYSDLGAVDADMFYIPFSAMVANNFTRQLSGIIGVQVRAGFDQILMPIVGLDWQINDSCRLNARLPQSSFIYKMNEYGSFYLGFRWRNMSYAMDDDTRDQITLNELRFYGGASFLIADGLYAFVEAGRVFSREISFDLISDDTVDYDVDPALTMRFGLHGPF